MVYNPVRLKLFSFSMQEVQSRVIIFLFHQKLFNHFQENTRGEKKCIALLVLTEPSDLSDSVYASLPDET